MSADNNEAATESFCASCGVAEDDDTKLKKCTACYLVKYCGIKCQKDHRPEHKRACKKRAAELRDELLFKQPERSHDGDCPICCLPLPLFDRNKSIMFSCCNERICQGCCYANEKREIEMRLASKCPFCRHPRPKSEAECERIDANDPVALRQFGTKFFEKGDCKRAFEYWTKAAELGDVEAHYQLSCTYEMGDEVKRVYHLEKAAIGGHPLARHNLGYLDWENVRRERAIKHLIIAASLGYDESVVSLKIMYQKGMISKEDFAAALRAHQAALDATKSPQREEAEAVGECTER